MQTLDIRKIADALIRKAAELEHKAAEEVLIYQGAVTGIEALVEELKKEQGKINAANSPESGKEPPKERKRKSSKPTN